VGARDVSINLELQRKQNVAFESSATEILYGGAAFGGKSHLMRVAAISWCFEIPGLMVYLFRRVEDDLIKNHMEGPHGFRALLADWVQRGLVEIVQTEIRFLFNGARIFLCHCKDEAHRFKYHGAEIHVLMIDELTTFSDVIYRYLRFRTRMVGIKDRLPAKYRAGEIGPSGEVNEHDLFPRILNGSNPGNVGHSWVKRAFVDAVPAMKRWKTPDEEGGFVRQYVPALMADNPIGMSEDPDYVKRTRGLLDPELVRAMESGDWNVTIGGFFSELARWKHVIKATTFPKDWKRFTMTDWGSSAPFWSGWAVIVQDDVKVTGTVGNEISVPRGSLVVYREWYGCRANQLNVGIQLPVESWAMGVLKRCADEAIEYDVCDTSMFDEDGGPSLAERAGKVKLKDRKLRLRPADKRRLPGWNQIRYRLQGDQPGEGDERPTLYFSDDCPHVIRTLESLQRDELNREDADTDGEDHPPDAVRYGCMSRPRRRSDPEPKFTGPKAGTMDWLLSEAWKKRKAERSYDVGA
jgi:hypothetical protein